MRITIYFVYTNFFKACLMWSAYSSYQLMLAMRVNLLFITSQDEKQLPSLLSPFGACFSSIYQTTS